MADAVFCTIIPARCSPPKAYDEQNPMYPTWIQEIIGMCGYVRSFIEAMLDPGNNQGLPRFIREYSGIAREESGTVLR
jgi:hypothetical protein